MWERRISIVWHLWPVSERVVYGDEIGLDGMGWLSMRAEVDAGLGRIADEEEGESGWLLDRDALARLKRIIWGTCPARVLVLGAVTCRDDPLEQREGWGTSGDYDVHGSSVVAIRSHRGTSDARKTV